MGVPWCGLQTPVDGSLTLSGVENPKVNAETTQVETITTLLMLDKDIAVTNRIDCKLHTSVPVVQYP